MRSLILPLALLAALAPAARAQIVFGDVGFTVQSTAGVAGDACWGFDCRPRPLAARATGERLSLTLRAPLGAGYAVVLGAGTGACTPIAGVWHELVLTAPLAVIAQGAVATANTGRFCYDGVETLVLPLPTLPAGTRFGLQAAAQVGTPLAPATGWALSSAVQLTAR